MTILLFWLLCGLSFVAIRTSLLEEKMEKHFIAFCILFGPFLILILVLIAFLNNPFGVNNYFRNLERKIEKKIKKLDKELEDLKNGKFKKTKD